MKKYFIIMLTIVVASCADENLKPIVTFDDAGHGAYIRLASESGSLVADMLSQATFDASEYIYSVDFVDDNGGNNVATYIVEIAYVDVTGANSVSSIDFRTLSSSDFSPGEDYMGAADIRITGNEAAAAFGLTYSDLNVGDVFELNGSLIMKSGAVHKGSNSAATIHGAAFQGHFDFNMTATCPTPLAGEYAFSTDLNGSPDWSGIHTGTVEIFQLSSGSWSFDDWSFGGYLAEYGCCVPAGDFHFDETCGVAVFYDATDEYEDEWSIVASISGNDLIIAWTNYTYAAGREQGISTITFPDGVPFTL